MPTPDLVTLAQTYTDKQAEYEAAYSPVGEARKAVREAVTAALRLSPACAAALAAREALDASEAAYRTAAAASKEAYNLAQSPYRLTCERISYAKEREERAAKRLATAEERADARDAARSKAITDTNAARDALRAAYAQHNVEALAAEERRAYEAKSALWSAYHDTMRVVRGEAIALTAALPLPEGERKRLAEAAVEGLFPAA